MTSLFMTPEDIAKLTGYKQKGRQIDMLKRMGIPFRINACGQPVVTESAVEGRKDTRPKKTWEPSWAGIHQ